MIAARLHHELIAPLQELRTRLADNVCIQSEINDVTAQTAKLAIAAYHFPETVRGSAKAMFSPAAEDLRQRLGDVADTAKHGQLRNQSRQATLYAGLAFEADPNLGFRFLRTEVWAHNDRFGEFDLVNSIATFCEFLASEYEVIVDAHHEPPAHPFRPEAVAYVTKRTFVAANIRLFFYGKDGTGALVRSDPPEVRFAVFER
ncbi:hypothetical protein [Aminobacter sp. HY435]|uniref:hypothetical protein n=1 Tax=Aminobacter sp. HY435 TaxID=2970917 RepID=UPI0022B993C2|nr:hypothetical protein [Aminobacter sp. HY435]